MLRELARKVVQKELAPLIDDDERSETFRPEVIAALGKVGLTGVTSEEAHGGAGLGYSDYIQVIEEIAAVSASYAISVAVSGLPQIILSRFGTEEQKQRLIPPLAGGRAIGAFSLSEAGAGSDAAQLRATAKREGDFYLLKGTKHWCTQGDVADTIMVMARTGGPGPSGISTFAVPKNAPGLKMGKRERKMGLHCSHTMELILEDVRVPVVDRIGAEGEGFKIAMVALDSGRITIGATALGVARSALEVALNHARQREQFGRPIGEFQGVSFMLADMATQLQSARLMVEYAAKLRDESGGTGKELSVAAAMAKLRATDAAMQITIDAVQILGGSGYTQDFPVERYMRDAKVLQIVEGTNQIQRLVIGRSLLKDGLTHATQGASS